MQYETRFLEQVLRRIDMAVPSLQDITAKVSQYFSFETSRSHRDTGPASRVRSSENGNLSIHGRI